jgi:hypothetical protein
VHGERPEAIFQVQCRHVAVCAHCSLWKKHTGFSEKKSGCCEIKKAAFYSVTSAFLVWQADSADVFRDIRFFLLVTSDVAYKCGINIRFHEKQ